MATLFPKKNKRARAAEAASIAAEAAAAAESAAAEVGVSVFAQFERVDGEKVGPTVDLPISVTGRDMDLVLNELAMASSEQKYEFFVGGVQVTGKLSAVLGKLQVSSESVVTIQFQPQSIFRIAAVTRCTSSLPGHTEAIICAQFSPDCLHLATGGGDACVRLWDMNTETPRFVCKGHKNWVRFSSSIFSALSHRPPPPSLQILFVAWSPDGSTVASGSKDNTVRLWDAATGALKGKVLKSHTAFITCICWQPIHIGADKAQLVSCSKDSTLKVRSEHFNRNAD
jgi:ribosome assembly protein 4